MMIMYSSCPCNDVRMIGSEAEILYLESKRSGISMDILSEGSTVMVDTSDLHGKKGRCGIEYTPGSAVGIVILNELVPDADGHVHSMTEYRFRDTYPDIVW